MPPEMGLFRKCFSEFFPPEKKTLKKTPVPENHKAKSSSLL